MVYGLPRMVDYKHTHNEFFLHLPFNPPKAVFAKGAQKIERILSAKLVDLLTSFFFNIFLHRLHSLDDIARCLFVTPKGDLK